MRFQGPRGWGAGCPGPVSRAETQGSVVVGVLESSWVSSGVLVKDAQLGNPPWKNRSGSGNPSCARVWALGGSCCLGSCKTGSRSRKDQRLYLGPWEQSKSCYLQQEPLLTRARRPSAVSPPLEACRPPSTAPPAPSSGMLPNAPVVLKLGNRHLLTAVPCNTLSTNV